LGFKAFDRCSLSDLAVSEVTFADFFRRQWTLKTVCSRCDLQLEVTRAVIVRMDMMHLSPWDRRPCCPKIGCSGKAITSGVTRETAAPTSSPAGSATMGGHRQPWH
jgi:hypothetical protein